MKESKHNVGPCPICGEQTKTLPPIDWVGRKVIQIACKRCRADAALADGRLIRDIIMVRDSSGDYPEGDEADAEFNPVYIHGKKCWASYRMSTFALGLDEDTGAESWDEWCWPDGLPDSARLNSVRNNTWGIGEYIVLGVCILVTLAFLRWLL